MQTLSHKLTKQSAVWRCLECLSLYCWGTITVYYKDRLPDLSPVQQNSNLVLLPQSAQLSPTGGVLHLLSDGILGASQGARTAQQDLGGLDELRRPPNTQTWQKQEMRQRRVTGARASWRLVKKEQSESSGRWTKEYKSSS